MRNAEWMLSFPRGVGVDFSKLDDESEAALRGLLSDRLSRCKL